jgi:hypothetical protein
MKYENMILELFQIGKMREGFCIKIGKNEKKTKPTWYDPVEVYSSSLRTLSICIGTAKIIL